MEWGWKITKFSKWQSCWGLQLRSFLLFISGFQWEEEQQGFKYGRSFWRDLRKNYPSGKLICSLLVVDQCCCQLSSVLYGFFMSLFVMPLPVKKKHEALRAKLFWGDSGDSQTIPQINWNLTISPKEFVHQQLVQ